MPSTLFEGTTGGQERDAYHATFRCSYSAFLQWETDGIAAWFVCFPMDLLQSWLEMTLNIWLPHVLLIIKGIAAVKWKIEHFLQDLGYRDSERRCCQLLGKEEEPFNFLHPLPSHLCFCLQEAQCQYREWIRLSGYISSKYWISCWWHKAAHIQPIKYSCLPEQGGSMQNISWEQTLAHANFWTIPRNCLGVCFYLSQKHTRDFLIC